MNFMILVFALCFHPSIVSSRGSFGFHGFIGRENCQICKKSDTRRYVKVDLSERMFEVAITKNQDIKYKINIFDLEEKCLGVIISPNWIFTVASFLFNEQDPKLYRVYSGYLDLDRNDPMDNFEVAKIVIKPEYRPGVDDHNVAMVRVAMVYNFDSPNAALGKIPETALDFDVSKPDGSDCSIIGYKKTIYGTYVLASLKLALMSFEECQDRIRTLQLSARVGFHSFCVTIIKGASWAPDVNIAGATAVCGGEVRGIMPRNPYQSWIPEHPIPFIDVGTQTPWLRSTLLQLRASPACIILPSVTLIVILVLLYILF